MKNFVARFAVLGALLVLVANVSLSEAETVKQYFKAGGDLQLSPVPVSEKIYSIVWKYGKNLLAEWVEGPIDLIYYSKFKGRSELNTTTGVLTVHSMTADDIAVYTVEINNNVQRRAYQTVKIVDVPQPVVEVKPLACGSTSDSCKLICDGDVSQAGPVTYYWKKDDGEWKVSENNIMEIFNNKETWPVETFSCRMKNPVSLKDSKPIRNTFYKNADDTPTDGGNGGIIAGVIVAIILIVGATVGVYMLHKHKLLCFKNSDRTVVSMKDAETNDQPSSPDANGEAGEKA